jgi:hypothetical protein
MDAISNIFEQYFNKLDRLDLELLIASAIKKPRELCSDFFAAIVF